MLSSSDSSYAVRTPGQETLRWYLVVNAPVGTMNRRFFPDVWRHSFRSRQSVHYSVPPIIILFKTANYLYGIANVLYIEHKIFL